ncbi:ADP-ribosylglycohydrolase family protein [Cryobacterium sp. HLT2-28]|uniref:ADP-ribosylglycohydrolase family protein n=1 Tax=Cryobacterium sp. HLT2-28 TaxID=1259146 RepID=UPI00106A11A8|nr:ADP-ribosylglycohydrolase family protein [Cryobacterium sp. HLT2-28]TFB96996.1 ADP-ribosylglycohydrolase family protein [Cryobacterium sp. HLT2-28]
MNSHTSVAERDRALGAFYGLALGDALGMPTQSMSRSEILADYGPIAGFRDAGPRQRIAAGMPAGTVTDDTEQAVLLAGLVIEGRGHVDPRVFAARLLGWEQGMRARGSLDLLGPSTAAALGRLTDGESPLTSGRFGGTNGAAMRIAPVGIALGLEPLGAFVDAVTEANLVTHNTTLGIGSAAAVGAAVSAGIAGATLTGAITAAVTAAAEGERRGHWVAGASIAARIRWAVGHLTGLPAEDQADAVCALIGTSVAAQESVVAALALAAVSRDPWRTLCLVAGLGGDTDTIAAICGAVLGSVHGLRAWPTAELDALRLVNDLDLAPLVDGLLELRRERRG